MLASLIVKDQRHVRLVSKNRERSAHASAGDEDPDTERSKQGGGGEPDVF
jgi:hypothetical protein